MNEEYIDWKSRALAAEAETLNLKNLCAHHGICTACGEYYSHHYIEPFATCKCNTSEWYELTEYMKLQNELRKLREKDAAACWNIIAGHHVGIGGSGTTETTPKQHIFDDDRALLQSVEVTK